MAKYFDLGIFLTIFAFVSVAQANSWDSRNRSPSKVVKGKDVIIRGGDIDVTMPDQILGPKRISIKGKTVHGTTAVRATKPVEATMPEKIPGSKRIDDEFKHDDDDIDDDIDDGGGHSEKSLEKDDSLETPIVEEAYVKPEGLNSNIVGNIRKQVFNQANVYRKRHGCIQLKLNANMNNHAQYWANYLATTGDLRSRTTSDNGIYGQTIYTTTSSENIGETAVDTWYNQLRYIDVDDTEDDMFSNPNVIGFMIQLLWKKSKEMGVGVAKSSNGVFIIVAEYSPRGVIYPHILENLPKFTQNHINTAKNAHRELQKKTLLPQQKSLQLLSDIRNNQKLGIFKAIKAILSQFINFFTGYLNLFSGFNFMKKFSAPLNHGNVEGSHYWQSL